MGILRWTVIDALRSVQILIQSLEVSGYFLFSETSLVSGIHLKYFLIYTIIDLLCKKWSTLSVRLSSYGCTREVGTAREKRSSGVAVRQSRVLL